ncbi:MAG: hypothetical protein FXF54_00065 [Kosmotoga sp.]|nr:MAG: hypothetical protein FXF54_00065 [Kosmotoga sp.]
MDLSFLDSLLKAVIENWFIVLPVALFMYFGARFLESVTLFLVGAAIGFFYINPLVMSWITQRFELTDMWLNVLPYIIAIVIAIAFLAIYKIAVFVLVAIASGGLVYFLLEVIADAIVKSKEAVPGDITEFLLSDTAFYVFVGIAVVVGIVGGIIGTKRSKEFFQVFSVILGSIGIVLSLYTFVMTSIIQGEPLFRRLTQEEIDKLTVDLGALHLSIMAVIVVVLCIYKISRIFRRKRPVTHQEQDIQE